MVFAEARAGFPFVDLALSFGLDLVFLFTAFRLSNSSSPTPPPI